MRNQNSALSVSPPFSGCPLPPPLAPATSKHRLSQRAHALRRFRPHHPQELTDQARELLQKAYYSVSLQPPHAAPAIPPRRAADKSPAPTDARATTPSAQYPPHLSSHPPGRTPTRNKLSADKSAVSDQLQDTSRHRRWGKRASMPPRPVPTEHSASWPPLPPTTTVPNDHLVLPAEQSAADENSSGGRIGGWVGHEHGRLAHRHPRI